jgi:hypothetical protein
MRNPSSLPSRCASTLRHFSASPLLPAAIGGLGLWLLVLPAFAQQPQSANPEVEAIRREMEQLRQDYENRLRQLDERLKVIETGKPPGTTPPAPNIPPAAPPAPAVPAGLVEKTATVAATNSLAGAGEQRRIVEGFFANTTESRS